MLICLAKFALRLADFDEVRSGLNTGSTPHSSFRDRTAMKPAMSPCGIRTCKSWNESGTPLSRQEARPTGSWLSEGMRSNPAALLPGRGRARARCCLLAVLLVRYQNRCAKCERYVLPSRRLLNN